MADVDLDKVVSRGLTRRTMMKAAAGTAVAGSVATGLFYSRPHFIAAESIETIAADIERTGVDFARGDAARGELAGAVSADGIFAAGGSGPMEYVSDEIQVDFPMTHVAAHWSADYAGGDFSVETRYSPDGTRWTDWFPVKIEAWEGEAPNPGVFGALQLAYGATIAQYRVRFDNGGGSVLLKRLTLTCLNVNDGARAKVLVPGEGNQVQAGPYVSKPSVVTRAGWGANESYRYSGSQEKWLREFSRWKLVVPHHTATPNDYVDSAAQVRSVYYYHAMTLGWGDIGYHCLIGNDNRRYEGRKSRDGEVFSLDLMAGHVLQCNAGSFGMSWIGDFSYRYIPSGMLTASGHMAAWVCAERGIDPNAKINFTRADNSIFTGSTMPAHRHIQRPDLYPTACPGDTGYSQFGSLRARVTSRLDSAPTKTPVGTVTQTPTAAPKVYTIVGSGRSANSLLSTRIWDGYTSTYWRTYTSDTPPSAARVYVELDATRFVGSVKWFFGRAGWADYCTIEGSTDKLRWWFIGDASVPTAGIWYERLVNREARYIRFVFNNPDGLDYLGGLAELQVWPPT